LLSQKKVFIIAFEIKTKEGSNPCRKKTFWN
jgi:hypothetical protein